MVYKLSIKNCYIDNKYVGDIEIKWEEDIIDPITKELVDEWMISTNYIKNRLGISDLREVELVRYEGTI